MLNKFIRNPHIIVISRLYAFLDNFQQNLIEQGSLTCEINDKCDYECKHDHSFLIVQALFYVKIELVLVFMIYQHLTLCSTQSNMNATFILKFLCFLGLLTKKCIHDIH